MSGLSATERFFTWLRVEQGRSPLTIEAYGRDIRHYEKFLAEQSCDVLTVKSEVIERYVAILRASGRAPKSIARQFAAVRVLHRFMSDEGLRDDNPTTVLDGVKVPSGLPKALSEDQQSAMEARSAEVAATTA